MLRRFSPDWKTKVNTPAACWSGRRHLDFSKWEACAAEVQSHQRMQISEEVGEKGMPPWY